MKIVHIAPNAPYNEGWSYQENLLPKYQKKIGHEVILYITNLEHKGGGLVKCPCTDSITADGFRVVRKEKRSSHYFLAMGILTEIDIYDDLVRERPDFIFYHGLIDATIFQVTQYKKKINPACVIVQDNHYDSNNGFNLHSLKGFIKRNLCSHVFKSNMRYISKVYGVTPARKIYAQKVFGVPSQMSDVLIMGADDEELLAAKERNKRAQIRSRYSVKEEEFLIVTGGKIDRGKNIHQLMKAVNELSGVKLIVFGNVYDDIKDEFDSELSEKVHWVGFIPSRESYDYFMASDIVIFPGQHSVLWEQACAAKVPCAFNYINGLEHLNNGGNSIFIEDITVEGLKKAILSLLWTPKYYRMKSAAQSDKTDIYLYSKIAQKSLEMAIEVS